MVLSHFNHGRSTVLLSNESSQAPDYRIERKKLTEPIFEKTDNKQKKLFQKKTGAVNLREAKHDWSTVLLSNESSQAPASFLDASLVLIVNDWSRHLDRTASLTLHKTNTRHERTEKRERDISSAASRSAICGSTEITQPQIFCIYNSLLCLTTLRKILYSKKIDW